MRNLFVLFLSSIVVACGGGSSSGATVTPTPTPTPLAGSVSGIAHDGPLSGASISVHPLEGVTLRDALDYSTSDDTGRFELTFRVPSGTYALRTYEGTYIEEASGTIVETLDNGLRTFFDYIEGNSSAIPITPATHWASCYAEFLFETDGNENAVAEANATISDLFGFDIVQTTPVDITLSRPLSVLNSSVLSGYIYAAISSLTAGISEENNSNPHTSGITSTEFIRLGCDDIRADGLFDGIGENGQLMMFQTSLNSSYYREKLAQNILRIANSEANGLGFTAADLHAFANQWSQSNHMIWNGIPGSPVDIQGPSISSNFDASGIKSAVLSFDINVSDDLVGVSSVTMIVNAISIVASVSIADGVTNFQLDTTDYDDGDHIITFRAVDFAGNQSDFLTFNLDFSNTAPTISFTSESLTNQSTYLAMGDFSTAGVSIDRIEVNGQAAILSSNFWSLNVILDDDVTELTATIYDVAGNSSSSVISVMLDNILPQIVGWDTTVRISNSAMQFNLCNSARFSGLNNNALCLLSNRVSLDGQAVTESLSNDDIWSAAIRFDDSEFREVFTEIDDLVVEYKYEKAGVLVIDWIAATRLGLSNDRAYVPITTEFLGDSFYLTDIDDEHTITFRVTDESGNVSERAFNFRLNLIDPI